MTMAALCQEALLSNRLESKGSPSLLGGQGPLTVVNNNQYVSTVTTCGQGTDEYEDAAFISLDHAIHAALCGENKPVVLIGPAGSGKTTALEKLIVDWAKGAHLQNLTYLCPFGLKDLNGLDGSFSLKTLMSRSCHGFSPDSMPSVLQNPEKVLFVFDELDQYKHSLDPSVQTMCSDPNKSTTISSLVAGLLHGTLLNGATILIASRPTGCLTFLNSTKIDLLGFLKPQRKTYFERFFTDQNMANIALLNMEQTLGFYDFCSSPRFCWTVCSIYRSLLDVGEGLPATLTQMWISILVQLIGALSLNKASARELVLALGRMASHCCLNRQSTCTAELFQSFGLQQFLTFHTSTDSLLLVDGDLESDQCSFSFHTHLIQELLLAVSFFLDESSESVNQMLEKHEGHVKYLDLYMSGLLNCKQRKPLEAVIGNFNSDRLADFECWLRSSSQETLKGCYQEKHFKCFRLLHQNQNQMLVKEIITPSARIGISYGDLSLGNCVALNYIFVCLGEVELLNLYGTKNLTEEEAEILTPAICFSDKIMLSQSSLSTGAVAHLASALTKGRTKEVDLSYTHLGNARLKILCTGLRDCRVQKLKLTVCRLTEEGCGDIVSVLTSSQSQLCVLDLMCNELGDQGLTQLCQALHSPICKLQELHLRSCELTAVSMEALSGALCSGHSQLRILNLTLNTIGDSGVAYLSQALQHPLCKLQSLKLFDSQLTGGCCPGLSEALRSEHCSLLELDLSVNELGTEGALLLCKALSKPGCPMEKLWLVRCEFGEVVFKELGMLLLSGTSQLKSLSVSMNSVGDQGAKYLWNALADPHCLLEVLGVEMIDLTDACVGDLCVAVGASRSLRSLDLSNNNLTDASVAALIQVAEESVSLQEMDLKYNDFSEEVYMMYNCDKIRY